MTESFKEASTPSEPQQTGNNDNPELHPPTYEELRGRLVEGMRDASGVAQQLSDTGIRLLGPMLSRIDFKNMDAPPEVLDRAQKLAPLASHSASMILGIRLALRIIEDKTGITTVTTK